MTERESVRIVLTPEQQAEIKRLSGQDVEAIEVDPADLAKHGGNLHLTWRLSVASGIPRQAWTTDQADGANG